jgi:eukaryotic-like serine/threonine-protein kinase
VGDAERQVEDHLARIGLAATEILTPPGATITPRTLGRSLEGAGAGAALPRISLDIGGADIRVVAVLGEGGMGLVHLARQRSLEREVAVKTLKDGAPPDAAAGLLREAQVTGSLEHPGVVPVHALGLDDGGRPLLVMKRVEGADWRVLLEDPESPAWGDRPRDRLVAHLEILMRVCETLELAHSRRVVHRDIKPENVRVGRFGEVYLMDWGIALRIDPPPDDYRAELVGTPAYMAPEMASSGAVDERTDVYLLGATLHEILTGRRRHDEKSVIAALARALRSEPVVYDASVPASLSALANAATARDPAARPPSVRAFREEVETFLRLRSLSGVVDAALSRLGELEVLLAAGAPPDLGAAYRLVNEARFGFTQCLREHPAHAPARAGRRRCLVAQVELELCQDHVESAEAFLSDLDPPDPALAQRVAEAKERAAERRREGDRLRALDHDLDPTVASRERTRVIGLLCLPVLGLSVFAIRTGAEATITPAGLLAVSLFVLAFALVVSFVLRRAVLSNLFNRRVFALLALAMGVVTLNRALGVARDDPVSAVIARDLLVISVAMGAGAATLVPDPVMAAGAAAVFLAHVVASLRPGYAFYAFWATAICELATLLLVLRRRKKAEAETKG